MAKLNISGAGRDVNSSYGLSNSNLICHQSCLQIPITGPWALLSETQRQVPKPGTCDGLELVIQQVMACWTMGNAGAIGSPQPWGRSRPTNLHKNMAWLESHCPRSCKVIPVILAHAAPWRQKPIQCDR